MTTTTRNASESISQLKAFKTSGALSAEWQGSVRLLGHLPEPFRAQLKGHERQAIDSGDHLYIVYSYATPIAWVWQNKAYIPDIKYSVTTSRHQSQARQGLSHLENGHFFNTTI